MLLGLAVMVDGTWYLGVAMPSVYLPGPASSPEGHTAIHEGAHLGRAVPMTGEPCRATVARQFSLWPFGTRLLRLFLVVDPSEDETALMRGLLRAMQQEYFRSEGRSQTNALRSTILAAHYVLRHHNRESLPQDWATAAAACAVTRGTTAYVALAGDAAALTWDGRRLVAQRNPSRVARPLGAEQLPRVSFWSASVGAGQRLALVSGAAWQDDSLAKAEAILRSTPLPVVEQELAAALAGPYGPARVLVADGPLVVMPRSRYLARAAAARANGAGASHEPQASVAPVPNVAPRSHPAGPRRNGVGARQSRPPRRRRARLRLPKPVLAVLALVVVVAAFLMATGPFGEPQHVALARQAETLLDQAEQSRSPREAHTLAANAQQLAQRASSAAPFEHGAIVSRAGQVLGKIDRVYTVDAASLIQLGGASVNVVDLAPDEKALYALDIDAGTVLRFPSSQADQTVDAGVPVVQRGRTVAGTPLDIPIAMAIKPAQGGGILTVLDRARGVVQFSDSLGLVRRTVPQTREWQRITAVSTQDDTLYLLDGDAGRLLAYDGIAAGLTKAPRLVFDLATAAAVPFRSAVDFIPAEDVFVRDQSGAVRRFDRKGQLLPFDVEPPDDSLGPVSAMAQDGAGGLYLSDPSRGRIVHVTRDGRFLRQIRPAQGRSFDALRSIQPSVDHKRLYAIADQTVMALSLPADVPQPIEPVRTAGGRPQPPTPSPSIR